MKILASFCVLAQKRLLFPPDLFKEKVINDSITQVEEEECSHVPTKDPSPVTAITLLRFKFQSGWCSDPGFLVSKAPVPGVDSLQSREAFWGTTLIYNRLFKSALATTIFRHYHWSPLRLGGSLTLPHSWEHLAGAERKNVGTGMYSPMTLKEWGLPPPKVTQGVHSSKGQLHMELYAKRSMGRGLRNFKWCLPLLEYNLS